MKYPILLASLMLAQLAFADGTLLLKQPAISADKLAFVYAGDIWVANRDGTAARRLTSHAASESAPTFSPDGTWLAFVARYEDNADVYVVPVDGGQPRRLTWHPADDIATGWTADGSAVTFVSRRETDHGRAAQWYHVPLAGGLPEKQMEARVFRGVYDSSDRRLAYMAFGSGYNGLFGGTAGWKGYRGGSTPPIHIMNLETQTVTTVPGAGATNFNPMWANGTLYFLSDRGNKIANVYRFDELSGEVVRVSNEDLWEVRSAGAFGSSLVYESGGRLRSIDLDTGVVRDISISIQPDLPQLRVQWKSVANTVQAADISPSGKRVIVTARGDVFTVPTGDGSTRNISSSGGRREYSGIWSPAGDQVAYIVESLQGQSLVIADQTGMGDTERYELGPHFYELLDWSAGDDARIAFSDNHLSLYTIDVDDGDVEKIATGARRDDIDATFSPDGEWLAHTVEGANYHRGLELLQLDTGNRIALTDGSADVAAPTFSHDGQILYFAASTNSGPLQVGLNMSSRERPYRAGLYATVLAADGKSPLLPVSGDEDAGDDSDSGDESDDADDDPPAGTRVDAEGIVGRIVALPVAERNYHSLAAGNDGHLYFVDAVQPGASNEPPGDNAGDDDSLVRFDFEEKEATTLLTGVDDFAISANGTHLLIARTEGTLSVAELGESLEPEALSLDELRMQIDPREEWQQIFDEAWRMEQEYFYDPNLHGLDWQAVYDRYRPLVEHVGRREDLGDLIVQMIGELQVGHNRSGGGDRHREQGTNTGLLGANLDIDRGRYRIARVYSGETWNPFIEAPLATPGNEAREGEYILAVNGQPLDADENIFERLQGTAGKQVTLRVADNPDGQDARDIVIEPTGTERALRLWHWIENNRRQVAAATDNRVGYVYLPNTAAAGFTFFNRMFFAQIDKEAMIIDERSNGGGQAANYITDVLGRRHLSGWKDRDGEVFDTPAGAIHGPKVMLIDQDAGSGGDYLPYTFRYLELGKLIGTRTWGGLIGISANPGLVDGGSLSVPFFRFFNAEGDWAVENEGVAPDIDVGLDPIATNNGRDTQLERAVAEILEQLDQEQPGLPPAAPAYPTRLGE